MGPFFRARTPLDICVIEGIGGANPLRHGTVRSMTNQTPTRRVAQASRLRAARYSRVSEDETGQCRSVTEQDNLNTATIRSNGWMDAGAYCDNDIGASQWSRGDREDWHRLMDDMGKRMFDVLVVWELSRSHRDRMVWAALVAACQQYGVLLCEGGKIYDLDDPDDAFMLDLKSATAIRESAVTRKRVKRSVDGNAVNGRPHGKQLYGYQRTYDPLNGVLTEVLVDPVAAALIREAAKRVLAGEPCRAIARDFWSRGITAPRGGQLFRVKVKGVEVKRAASMYWGGPQIRETLLNPAYAGLRVHRGEIVGKAMWPPILTMAQHQALVEKLTDPSRLTRREDSIRHLCTGIVTCGKRDEAGEPCGGRMRFLPNRGRLTYTCGKGFCTSVGAQALDNEVEKIILEWLVQKAGTSSLVGDEDDSVQAASLLAKELEARLQGFYVKAAHGKISDDGIEAIERELLPQLAQAKDMARGRVPMVVRDLLGATGGAEGLAAAWEALTIPSRRDAISWIADIELMPARCRGVRTFDPNRVVPHFRGAEG